MTNPSGPGPLALEVDLNARLDLAYPGVCLIEDDADLRMALARTLRAEGYRVVEAADGADVIGRLSTDVPGFGPMATIDVIVTDQRMPRVTGLDVLEHVRTTDWATPVILMTAFYDEDLAREARRLGALAVLPKPLDLDDLLDAIDLVAPMH